MKKKATKRKISVKKSATRKIKKPKEPKVGKYLNLEYESFCELSLLFFVEEMKKYGFIHKVERSPSYLLSSGVTNTYVERLKRGSKSVDQSIQQGVTYTPDYDIYFTDKAIGKIIWIMDSGTKYDKKLLVAQAVNVNGVTMYRACNEVKPDFQRNSTTPKSVQSMKWLYQRHGVFTNLFRPNDIFERLFTPGKYLLTESGGKRKLKFIPKSIEEYLREKK